MIGPLTTYTPDKPMNALGIDVSKLNSAQQVRFSLIHKVLDTNKNESLSDVAKLIQEADALYAYVFKDEIARRERYVLEQQQKKVRRKKRWAFMQRLLSPGEHRSELL